MDFFIFPPKRTQFDDLQSSGKVSAAEIKTLMNELFDSPKVDRLHQPVPANVFLDNVPSLGILPRICHAPREGFSIERYIAKWATLITRGLEESL